MPVEPLLNLLGAAEYSKSSLSDIDAVTSPALSFTTLKSHGFRGDGGDAAGAMEI
jgi:hypothetical protein